MLAPEEDTSSLKYLLFLEYAYSAYRTVPELTNAVLHAIRENAAVREEWGYYSATSQVEILFRERLQVEKKNVHAGMNTLKRCD